MTVRAEVRTEVAAPDLPDPLRESLTEGLRLRCDVELIPAGSLAPDAKKILDERTWN